MAKDIHLACLHTVKKKKKNTPNYSSVTTILSALIQLLEQSDNSTIRAV